MNRRDLIKGVAAGVGAAMLPGNATPRLIKAAVDDVGTVAATKEALAAPDPVTVLKTGQAEYFSPMVIDSEITHENNLVYRHELGQMEPMGVSYGRNEIVGRFTMYVDTQNDAENLHRFMDRQEKIKLELAQGDFKYRMDAYVERITFNASAHELMTADVDFRALNMEVIENGSA